MRPKSARFLGLLVFAIVGPRTAEELQVPGYAEITAPSTGQVVSGIVTIEGTAAHPEFLRYDLAFAFPGDPTDTWFQITEAVDTPVHDSRLGIWDTSGITEGEYDLRLRVWTSSGEPLIARVPRIRVARTGPPASPTAAAGLGPATPSGSPTLVAQGPTPASTLEVLPPAPARIGRPQIAFGLGAVAAMMMLGGLAIYGRLRQGIRSAPGRRRSRRRPRRTGGSGR